MMNKIMLYSYMSRFLPKPHSYSQSPFINQRTIKDQKKPQNGSSTRGNIKVYHEIYVNRLHQRKKFSLIQPRSSKSLCDGRELNMENNAKSSYEKHGCGMILLKNYISLNDQVEIVNICQKLGFDMNGFSECIPDGEKLGLHMMLLGLKWYPPSYHTDDSFEKPLKVPDKIISLVKSSIQDSRHHLNSKNEASSKCANNCIVKFYTNTKPLSLFQERDHISWYRYRSKGWHMVSMFIGDSAEFFYGDSRHLNKANKILLESGDVLIFGKISRDIFHGIHRIIPNSAPLPFLRKSMLKPGLLNLSFRKF